MQKKGVNMLISCPKCNAVYMVTEKQIPQDGKKFKCAECGRVWTVMPEDLKNIEPESGQIKTQLVRPASSYEMDESDIEDMFNRLSRDTKGLFNNASSADSVWERFRRKWQVFLSPVTRNSLLLTVIIASFLYISYAYRYEFVHYVPQLEYFYNKIELESIYKGRNVVFKNVNTRNITRSGKHFVEISGLVYNQGEMKSALLPIKAVMKKENGEIVSETVKTLTLDRLNPDFGAVFRIVMPNDTPESKKVLLSFIQ